MLDRTLRRLEALEETAQNDEELQHFYGMLKASEDQFNQLLDTLPKEQKDLILDYICYQGEFSYRLVELACMEE